LCEGCEVYGVYVAIRFGVCSDAPTGGAAIFVLPEVGEYGEVGGIDAVVAGEVAGGDFGEVVADPPGIRAYPNGIENVGIAADWVSPHFSQILILSRFFV
jgi:hypothetical protein